MRLGSKPCGCLGGSVPGRRKKVCLRALGDAQEEGALRSPAHPSKDIELALKEVGAVMGLQTEE